jgi:mannose-1-phosphate guanylyltransferase
VILAGGQGTRLRPLTLARAKPVVPLLNRPFLAHQLALLRAHGVSDVILACSYRVDDVRAALGDGAALGVRLRYVVEREPLGTGGGVRNAADLVSGTLYVLNGDILTDADLTAMRALHESRSSRTTIYLQPVPDPRQYGLVETAADGRLRAFREKPTADEEITTNTINAGIYLIDAPLLQRIPLDRASSIEREFFPALIADGVPCYGWCPTAYWRDIGNPAAYRAAQIDMLHGRVALPLSAPGQSRNGSWLAAGSSVAPDAQIVAPSVIRRHARSALPRRPRRGGRRRRARRRRRPRGGGHLVGARRRRRRRRAPGLRRRRGRPDRRPRARRTRGRARVRRGRPRASKPHPLMRKSRRRSAPGRGDRRVTMGRWP